MFNLDQYSGSAKVLDRCLHMVHSKLNYHAHLFPWRWPNHINHVILLLDTWSNQQIPVPTQTAKTNPSESVANISVESDLVLQHLAIRSQKMPTVYCYMDWHCRVVMMLMQDYIQLPQESDRAYANHFADNWRDAVWHPQKLIDFIHNIGLAGICNCLKNTVGLMTLACGRFETLHEFFDKATTSQVTHVKYKKPEHR